MWRAASSDYSATPPTARQVNEPVRLGAKSRVEPKDVDYLAATLSPTSDDPVLIIAPYSARGRKSDSAVGASLTPT